MLDKLSLSSLLSKHRAALQYPWLAQLGSSDRIQPKCVLGLDEWFYLLDPSLVPSASHCLFLGSIHKAHGQNYNCVSEHLQGNNQKREQTTNPTANDKNESVNQGYLYKCSLLSALNYPTRMSLHEIKRKSHESFLSTIVHQCSAVKIEHTIVAKL